MKRVVSFGEIMLRLSTQDYLRFSQSSSLATNFGGAESNVAISLANFGIESSFITALPSNDLGKWCESELRKFQVNISSIIFKEGRLGLYFLENGAMSRSGKVVYDRADSLFSNLKPGDLNWDIIFDGADWFHWSGISPAVSQSAADVCLEAVKAAKSKGLTVSCDLNFRENLWKYGKQPIEVMAKLLEYCDVLLGNKEAIDTMMGVKLTEDIKFSYSGLISELQITYPSIHTVAISHRQILNGNHNTMQGLLFKDGNKTESTTFDLTHIVDRVGGGDVFMAGLIYGLLTYTNDLKTITFAAAASALKHTIRGDHNLVSVAEVEKLLEGDTSGRVSR